MTPDPAASAASGPVAAGNRFSAAIHDLAFGGEGVARIGELAVFVPFVVPGERVEIEVTEVKQRFARARLVRVLEASPDRVRPPCPYFGDCGGCQYQHLEYAAQLRLKQKQVADVLERLGGFSQVAVEPVVPCPRPYGYRNRIMVRTQWDKPKQRLNLGFIRYDNRLVVDIQECLIAEPVLNEQLRRLRAQPPPRGGLKVVLRIAPEGWVVPRDSFFQNNFHLLPRLVETVRDCLVASRARYLVDVYCGVGFFSLELAEAVEAFAGVELDHLAIQAARRNASLRGCRNGEFVAGNAEDLLPELLRRFHPGTTTVLIDPPRRGCTPPIIERLRQTRPAGVIYVSCQPDTLARDLRALCAGNLYELARVVPLDMFPQTRHIECVADLRLSHP